MKISFDELIDFYVEFCMFAAATKDVDSASCSDFIGWIQRHKQEFVKK